MRNKSTKKMTKRRKKDRGVRNKYRGGRIKNIEMADELVLHNRYDISFIEMYAFFDANDPDADDFISKYIAPVFNGTYRYIGSGTLLADGFYSEQKYYIFHSNSIGTIHLLNDESDYWDGVGKLNFRMLFEADEDNDVTPILFQPFELITEYEYASENTYSFCQIRPNYELENISRVSRKKRNTYLPVDVERNIQSFLIGNTVLDN